MKPATEMNTLEILTEVAQAEKENDCSDRRRLEELNYQLMAVTGKTAATILDELGM